MRAVILVSSLLSKKCTPAKVLNLVTAGIIIPSYDSRIYNEYEDVLSKPKFRFSEYEIKETLKAVTKKRFVCKCSAFGYSLYRR
ncbi:MAG: hypothetical protein NC078_12095, partial [Ruminococcus sp.]|nr:hypothetical protein [Ruminococcus sp.]